MHSLYDDVNALQDLLVAHATGSTEDPDNYLRLRDSLLSQAGLEQQTPRFLRSARSLGQFWQFIKGKFPTYAERRTYLWEEFRPLLELLERGAIAPSDNGVSATMEKFDLSHVQGAWKKALERRSSDPEGAITMARTLLESVCKHILDEGGIEYGDSPDLNRLYRLTADLLNLAPSQHTEPVFRQILGGCTAVVEGLGAVRNRLSDSHGKGRVGVKPAARHAELAVNLAGALAVFLLETAALGSRPVNNS